MKIFITNKKIGETPLEALRAMVKNRRLPVYWKYTYAGRLDPMASGVLLILANATQAQKEKFLALPKTYEADIIFGISSDTGDLLGIPAKAVNAKIIKNQILTAVENLIPSTLLPIPSYSSVPIKGRPSFQYAREKQKTQRPLRLMEIKSVEIGKLKSVDSFKLLKRVLSRTAKVKGDFRQKEILKKWQKILAKNHGKFPVIKLKISCGSGTYIRSIAEHLGKTMGTGALLYNLKRLSVGKYKINN